MSREPLDEGVPSDTPGPVDRARSGANRRRRRLLIVTATGLATLVVIVAFMLSHRAGPNTLRCSNRGIDVSSYQGTIDWQQVSTACLGFAYVRISGGTTPDTNAAANLTGARATMVAVGEYQYFHPAQDVSAQAQLMIAGANHEPGDLPPAIDVETTDGLGRNQVIASIQSWLTTVEDALGVRPLIYSNPTFWSVRIHAKSLTAYPLWIANYTTASEPTLPVGGGREDGPYGSTVGPGMSPGIGTQVDLDRAATPVPVR